VTAGLRAWEAKLNSGVALATSLVPIKMMARIISIVVIGSWGGVKVDITASTKQEVKSAANRPHLCCLHAYTSGESGLR